MIFRFIDGTSDETEGSLDKLNDLARGGWQVKTLLSTNKEYETRWNTEIGRNYGEYKAEFTVSTLLLEVEE